MAACLSRRYDEYQYALPIRLKVWRNQETFCILMLSTPSIMTVRFTTFSIPFALALSLAGCISAPDFVLLDRKTILEEQTAGELLTLADALRGSAIVPQAVPFTRGQLEAAGADLAHDALGRLVQLQQMPLSEIDYLDNLLVRRCIGEAGLTAGRYDHFQGQLADDNVLKKNF